MSEANDTEIILGTGKLLAIFFGLVVICGVFFGLGYSLGHSSPGAMTLPSGPTTVVSGPGAKPTAGVTLTTPAVTAEEATAPDPNAQTAGTTGAVSNDTGATDQAADDPGPTPTVKPAAQPTTTEVAAHKTATPELQGGSITVQVAAVTKQEDAEALADALRRKNYPVFVSPNVSADNLYHVQVGPFTELKDAEAMKSKLAGDGYNAIVKR